VRQRLDQKIALENAFRAVNRTPPSPAISAGNTEEIPGPGGESPSVDYPSGHFKDKLLFSNFTLGLQIFGISSD